MKQILRLFDFVFITRPVWLFSVWSLFLAGYYLESDLHAATPATNGQPPESMTQLIWVGVALTLILGAVFVLQQVMERNKPNREYLQLISPGFLTPKAAFIESVILLAAGLVLGFGLAVRIGLTFVIIVLVAGYLYSFAPFRLKDNPIAALLVNGIGAFAIFCVGWLVNGEFQLNLVVYSIPYACVIMAIHLYASLPEKDESAYDEAEKTTFPLRFGLAATVYTGLVFELVSLALAYVFQDELIFYPTFFSLPFFVWAAISVRKVEMVRAVKYPMFVLVMTMAFKWGVANGNQYFFFLVAGFYFLAKLYYRLRFGVNYPTLAIDSKPRAAK